MLTCMKRLPAMNQLAVTLCNANKYEVIKCSDMFLILYIYWTINSSVTKANRMLNTKLHTKVTNNLPTNKPRNGNCIVFTPDCIYKEQV